MRTATEQRLTDLQEQIARADAAVGRAACRMNGIANDMKELEESLEIARDEICSQNCG